MKQAATSACGIFSLLLCILCAGEFPLRAQQKKSDEADKPLRIQTTLVTVPVIAMDRDSKFVPELQQKDFQILEEGVQQEISFFTSSEEPLTVALMLDVSDSTESRMDQIRQAAMAFAEQLRERDQVIVVAFDSRTQILTEAVSDQQKIRDAIRRAETGGGTRLYDAVDFVIRERLREHRGRKAVILFTDGVDNGSLTTSEKVLDLVAEADVFVYPIEYRPAQDSPVSNLGISGSTPSYRGDYAKADTFLRMLAGASGARFQMVDNPKNMTRTFISIADELRKQYVIGYYPTAPAKPGQRRRIKVRSLRPDIVIRARNSYLHTADNQRDSSTR